MSLDDFIITHFTKGPGVDTLSTKIYSEVRKGINPSMYALSTLMFLVVMILLLLINMKPDEKAAGAKNAKISKVASQHPKLRKFRKVMMSRVVPVSYTHLDVYKRQIKYDTNLHFCHLPVYEVRERS